MNRKYWGATGAGVVGFAAAMVYFAQGKPPPTPGQRGCDLTMVPHGALVKGVTGTGLALAFSSRACSTGTVTVTHSEPDGGTATAGTCTLSSGACSYSDTLPDQTTTVVTGSITSGSVTRTDVLRATMDSLNPEVIIVDGGPGLAGDGSLVVVSGVIESTGLPLNWHVEAGDPGYYPDAYPGTDGGGHVMVSVVVLGGSDGGALVTAWNGATLAVTALTVTPQVVTQSITLPEGAVGILSLAATIGSGAYTLSIPAMVDTLVPPTPVWYYGTPVATDGGCAPCDPASDHPASGGMVCTRGCYYYVPPGQDGGFGGYTHLVNQYHADMELAVIIPPDAGYLWGNPATGQVETEFNCITQLQIGQDITADVAYPDGGSPADVAYPDGGSGIDFSFAAMWMCARSDAGCVRRWSP